MACKLKLFRINLCFFCLVWAISFSCNPAIAQISIFNQKSTQTKYLFQQIAALRVYTDYLKKGYAVVKDGTGLIKDIKNGEFDLHKSYFGSLKSVSSAIRKHPKASAIYKMLSEIEQRRGSIYSLCPSLPPAQATELKALLGSIASQSSIELDELLMVLEDGYVEMTDDQRIKRIDDIYTRVQKTWAWQRELHRRTAALVSYLQQSLHDLDQQRKMQ
ncbi:hypothetical protein [Chitinophaga sp. OAE865]|uniref:hypothetical protein n=1 Tax=Chitinophaga sp. OAE865 TaxID=2817898 RepID=UPI001AE36844